MNSFGFSSSCFGAFADVGGRLAGVADPLGFGEDDLAVGVFDEVADRADRLPALLAAVEDRRDGEADGGQDDRRAGEPAERLDGDREGAAAGHRLALEVAGRVGLRPLLPGGRLGPVLLVRLVSHSSDSGAAESIDSALRTASPIAGARPRSPERGRPRRSRPSAWQLGAAADQVGELAHRLGVAERGEALDAERVEIVAGEQGEVRVVAGEQPRLAVVEEVALADRLDHQRVLAGRPRRGARRRRAGRGRLLDRVDHVRRDRRLLRRAAAPRAQRERRRAGLERSLIRGLARATRRPLRGCGRSLASSWASETNQASNCEGGG